jgi:hypothetical protein
MHALISILPRTAGFWFVIAIFLFILVLVIRMWILSIFYDHASKFNNWKKTIEKGQRIHDRDVNAQLMIFLIWNSDFEQHYDKKGRYWIFKN